MRGDVEKVGVIRDPAVAVAAAKCWLWRWSRRVDKYSRGLLPGLEQLHTDDPCGFCDIPADALVASLSEFIAWGGLSKSVDEGTPFRPEIEAFLMLDPEEQRRLVREEQYG